MHVLGLTSIINYVDVTISNSLLYSNPEKILTEVQMRLSVSDYQYSNSFGIYGAVMLLMLFLFVCLYSAGRMSQGRLCNLPKFKNE